MRVLGSCGVCDRRSKGSVMLVEMLVDDVWMLALRTWSIYALGALRRELAG